MQPDQRYTIGEAVALLDVDRATLRHWMELEGMQTSADTRDRRYKYVTRGQIEELARIHDRGIRDERAGEPRLTATQRDLRDRIAALEELVRRLTAATPHLPQPSYLPPPQSEPVPLPPHSVRSAVPRAISGDALPEGWVAAVAFARTLGLSETTARGWMRRGWLPEPHRGQWSVGPAGTFHVTLAYDPDQQQAARAAVTRHTARDDG
jgi:hypothetical protein